MSWFKINRKYMPVPVLDSSRQSDELLSSSNDYESEIKSGLDEDGIEREPMLSSSSRGRHQRWISTIMHGCSFLTFLLGVVMIVIALLRKPTDSECIKKLTVWCKFMLPYFSIWTNERSGIDF